MGWKSVIINSRESRVSKPNCVGMDFHIKKQVDVLWDGNGTQWLKTLCIKQSNGSSKCATNKLTYYNDSAFKLQLFACVSCIIWIPGSHGSHEWDKEPGKIGSKSCFDLAVHQKPAQNWLEKEWRATCTLELGKRALLNSECGRFTSNKHKRILWIQTLDLQHFLKASGTCSWTLCAMCKHLSKAPWKNWKVFICPPIA